MIKAVLFPCDILSIREVDSCFTNEYEAVVQNGNFEIYFYDYEEFVRDGTLRVNRKPEVNTITVLRGWMLNDVLYKRFYESLKEKNFELITTPEQYAHMHLFPNVYPEIKDDTPGILVYPDGKKEVSLNEIKSNFKKFMIKDFVKSEKGTDFPKYFDDSIQETDFKHWLSVFRDYRGKLFTKGFCIKEYVELKKYGEKSNEWRVFYANGKPLSVSKNSGQKNFEKEVPKALVEKYTCLPSPFYTIDFAELSDGSWKILEAGDGQVSGLSDNQNAEVFFRRLKLSFE